jgi:hypothetical protein
MMEVIRRIIRMDKQGRLTICGIDTLIRIDEGLGLTMCNNCAFKDTGLNLLACPYRSLVKEEIK